MVLLHLYVLWCEECVVVYVFWICFAWGWMFRNLKTECWCFAKTREAEHLKARDFDYPLQCCTSQCWGHIPSEVQFLLLTVTSPWLHSSFWVYGSFHFSLVACTPANLSQLQGLDPPLHACCHGYTNSYVTLHECFPDQSSSIKINVGGHIAQLRCNGDRGWIFAVQNLFLRPACFKRDNTKKGKLYFEVTAHFSW